MRLYVVCIEFSCVVGDSEEELLHSPIDLIQSTVQIDQAIGNGQRVVGTGFLVSSTDADGKPRTILITANHVFADMQAAEVRVGFRSAGPQGWASKPETLRIRDGAGAELWTHHPQQDVAAITIKAPPEFARAAIPLSYLASDAPAQRSMTPGDELLVLGYPRGLSANAAGFPILRSGRVASYPTSPDASPTFLLDFSVFPGNSGGPVFFTSGLQRAATSPAKPFIAGILTQQVELDHERLEIGIVVHARYIAETVDLLYGGRRPVPQALPASPLAGAQPVAHKEEPPSIWRRAARILLDPLTAVRSLLALVIQDVAQRALAWSSSART